jgi:type II secretory pathway pseudopilin PulG
MTRIGHRSGRTAGFSVVELAVVISLAGILVAIAVWRTGPAIERARARQAASTIAADLQYAQMVAARQREPVVVIVNASLRLLLIRSRGGTIFRRRFTGPDTEFGLDTLMATPSTVEIFPNGVAAQTVTYTVGRATNTEQIRLTRAGQVRVLP